MINSNNYRTWKVLTKPAIMLLMALCEVSGCSVSSRRFAMPTTEQAFEGIFTSRLISDLPVQPENELVAYPRWTSTGGDESDIPYPLSGPFVVTWIEQNGSQYQSVIPFSVMPKWRVSEMVLRIEPDHTVQLRFFPTALTDEARCWSPWPAGSYLHFGATKDADNEPILDVSPRNFSLTIKNDESNNLPDAKVAYANGSSSGGFFLPGSRRDDLDIAYPTKGPFKISWTEADGSEYQSDIPFSAMPRWRVRDMSLVFRIEPDHTIQVRPFLRRFQWDDYCAQPWPSGAYKRFDATKMPSSKSR